MDRVVKYRYWDEKAKKMLYCDKNNYYAYYGGIAQRVWEKPVSGGFTEATLTGLPFYAVPLQLTGLKDKNGKDIYEGDILECYLDSSQFAIGGYGGLTEIRSVKYDTEMAAFDLEYISHDHKMNIDSGLTLGNAVSSHWDLTVVGNVYTNPEMVADEKYPI